MTITRYEKLQIELPKDPKTWLITGVAGFIGSNVLETLLKLDQTVVGLDNFTTGYQKNLDEVEGLVTRDQWKRFKFIEGDIRDLNDCKEACTGVDYVLHEAALGSVPRSLEDPISTNGTNISGFLNMLVAARDSKVKSFTYAASSSTYGDHPDLPKVEDKIGKPLSPYAVTKFVNEVYADVFARCYGFNSVGLRYFNVFGPRQDPNGAYAAVIPKWIASIIKGERVYINGDGETSRDFTYVANAVQANILSATVDDNHCEQSSVAIPPLPIVLDNEAWQSPLNHVYNVALGDRTTLNELFYLLRNNLALQPGISSETQQSISVGEPVYRDFRTCDVRHSQADVTKAKQLLGYAPTHNLAIGIQITLKWYQKQNNG